MRKILFLIIAICLLFSLAACSFININVKEQQQNYDTATRYMRQGKYEEAIATFNALGDYKDSTDRAKYCEAQSYCYVGDYQSAYNILIQISNMQEADALLREIFFETRLFEGLSDLRKYFKNPNSISVTSVRFAYSTNTSDSWQKNNPACIITVSAQNGFGGYSTSYVLLTQDKGSDRYTYYGSCNSLDYSDIDDFDDFYEAFIAEMIKIQLEKTEISNPVNIDRVNEIISLQKYSNIARISSQKYTDIDY